MLEVTTISSYAGIQGFIFHMVRVAQDWLQANCPGFIEKNHWPPNSPDLNPLDYHAWGVMLEKYHKLQLKTKTTDELNVAFQTIWKR